MTPIQHRLLTHFLQHLAPGQQLLLAIVPVEAPVTCPLCGNRVAQCVVGEAMIGFRCKNRQCAGFGTVVRMLVSGGN